jgi:hypothetical protein
VGHMIYNISFAGLGCASTCYSWEKIPSSGLGFSSS